jgi:predicted DNA-binding protein with PD1-like motif
MYHREVSGGRDFLARLETGAEWNAEIEALAEKEELDAGWFTAQGAVQDAVVVFYDQSDFEYRTVEYDEPLTVAACVGSLAREDGHRTVRSHAVLSRRSGQTLSGRLGSATVFEGELRLRSFAEPLEREHDEPTDMALWL